jgi:hypothetical protein
MSDRGICEDKRKLGWISVFSSTNNNVIPEFDGIVFVHRNPQSLCTVVHIPDIKF